MNKCKKKWLLKRMWYNVKGGGGKAMYVDEKVSALALLLRKKPKKKKLRKQNQFSKTQEQGISISKWRVFLLTFHDLILWLLYVHLYIY